jgi:exodeoxyribonuclease VII large subunit
MKEVTDMDISSLRERSSGAITVTELNNFIKNLFDSSRFLSSVTVKGEISNFTYHRSGHLYFSLKDGESQIKAVMFRSSATKLKFMPESGMKILAHGSVSVYQRDGVYQMYITSMQPDGIGALYLAYEQLKEKLNAEGLFDEAHKKLLPTMPERVGVITSPTGAAVRDIINVIGRRFPLARIYLFPALVQGEGAEEDLIRGIDYLDNSGLVDVIIIGRGGGSAEDLWCFNDESLAMAIAESEIPVISAVGHETDFTICDFVADMRAPTPSAAAELAFFDAGEVKQAVSYLGKRCDALIMSKLTERASRLEVLARDIRLSSPESVLNDKSVMLERACERINSLVLDKLAQRQGDLRVLCTRLEGVNPLSVLSRGYSVVEGESGEIISRVDDAEIGQAITVRLSDGSIRATVTEKTANTSKGD